MDGAQLQDLIARGAGLAARRVGVLCNAFRCGDAAHPLAPDNRFLQLSAVFEPLAGGFDRSGLPSQPFWSGLFDSAYLRPGDFLQEVSGARTWFVAALQPLLPASCVLTNRSVSISRPGLGAVAGTNPYGGGATLLLVQNYPVSLLHGGEARGTDAIPADARIAGAVALVPPVAGVAFARGDLITDDLGRSYLVAQAEQNASGWRLDVRQAAS